MVRSIAAVLASAAIAFACGLSSEGTGAGISSGQDKTASDGNASTTSDAGGVVGVGVGVDAGDGSIANDAASTSSDASSADAASVDAGPCTACSSTCPQACAGALACIGGAADFCIASGTCIDGCDGCGKSECTICDPGAPVGGGHPRLVCTTPNTGACDTGLYPHCACTTQADCHDDNDVCLAGACTPCGQTSSTDNLDCRCGGGAKCDASKRDCNCN